jgi:zinc transport system ATP-binding protein
VNDPIVVLRGVSVRLGGTPVLEDVTAEFPRGKTTAIVGPNGAGKTTLIRAILGQVAFEGRVEIKACARPEVGRSGHLHIGYVPQLFDFDRGIPMTVTDFLALSLQRRPLWLGRHPSARKTTTAILARLGLDALAQRPLGGLSGGELQRVLLALALIADPELLILDEPVSGVDIAGEEQFCELLQNVQRAGRQSVLLVSHDLAVVHAHADYVLCLNRLPICFGPTREVLTADRIASIFGLVTTGGHAGRHEYPSDWFSRPGDA